MEKQKSDWEEDVKSSKTKERDKARGMDELGG